MGSPNCGARLWGNVCRTAIGLLLLGFSAGVAEEVVTAESFEEAITRGPRLRKKVKIDQTDGYTAPESSAVQSMPSILFERGQSVLLPSSQKQLDEIAKALVSIPTRGPVLRLKEKTQDAPMRILIEGHTCDIGGMSINQPLSEQRARAVRDYLVAKGVDASMLETRGWGLQRPAVPNTCEENREKNRRVDFVLRWHRDAVSEAVSGTRGLIQTTTVTDQYLEVTFEACLESQNGRCVVNDQIDVMRTGDKIRIAFRVLEACYVYILSLGSQGEAGWIWPENAESAARGVWCYYDSEHLLPGPTEGLFFELEDPPGREMIVVVALHTALAKVADLPAMLQQYGPALTQDTLRSRTGANDAELHMLVIDHQ